jgi:hypothetical protein
MTEGNGGYFDGDEGWWAEAGRKFAADFYATGRHSLISAISAAELAAWDGSDEIALVFQPALAPSHI